MRKTYKAICFFSLAVLVSFSASPAQPGTSYIIVHALNPQGIEIVSIGGMDRYSVKIYDGENLIGYGAYDTTTHNRPITLSSGTHTIIKTNEEVNLA